MNKEEKNKNQINLFGEKQKPKEHKVELVNKHILIVECEEKYRECSSIEWLEFALIQIKKREEVLPELFHSINNLFVKSDNWVIKDKRNSELYLINQKLDIFIQLDKIEKEVIEIELALRKEKAKKLHKEWIKKYEVKWRDKYEGGEWYE